MMINLTRHEMELVEKCLRYFFCNNDEPRHEDKTDKAFDLALEFENILNRNEGEYYEILAVH